MIVLYEQDDIDCWRAHLDEIGGLDKLCDAEVETEYYPTDGGFYA